MSLTRALFIFLILALCSWNGQKAQASDALPREIQRNWAQPDCGNYDEALILSRFFYLRSTQQDMTLLPARVKWKQPDHWVLDLGGDQTPVRLEADGVLKMGTAGTGRKSALWEELESEDTHEYTGCMDTPKLVPKLMTRLMRFIDRIKEQCTLKITNECAGVLFKLADENHDKKLSKAEIKRAVASTILFAGLAEKRTLPDAEALTLVKQSKADGDKIADELLKAHDKDNSKSLDYNELVTDFQPPNLPVVKETLVKAGALLPSFKLLAMALD